MNREFSICQAFAFLGVGVETSPMHRLSTGATAKILLLVALGTTDYIALFVILFGNLIVIFLKS